SSALANSSASSIGKTSCFQQSRNELRRKTTREDRGFSNLCKNSAFSVTLRSASQWDVSCPKQWIASNRLISSTAAPPPGTRATGCPSTVLRNVFSWLPRSGQSNKLPPTLTTTGAVVMELCIL